MLVRLKEDVEMNNNHFGRLSGGGTAKAGITFKVLSEPTSEKKMYKLEPVGVKFLYYLYLRKNEFKRLCEEI